MKGEDENQGRMEKKGKSRAARPEPSSRVRRSNWNLDQWHRARVCLGLSCSSAFRDSACPPRTTLESAHFGVHVALEPSWFEHTIARLSFLLPLASRPSCSRGLRLMHHSVDSSTPQRCGSVICNSKTMFGCATASGSTREVPTRAAHQSRDT